VRADSHVATRLENPLRKIIVEVLDRVPKSSHVICRTQRGKQCGG
jgi:hypothetical protein